MDTRSTEPSLPDVISRAQQGDKEAFAILYRLYYTPLYRYLFMRVRNTEEAEDLASETFLRSYQALSRYQHERETMLPYLFTIARNLLINHRKKKRPEIFLPEDIDRYTDNIDTSQYAKDQELHKEIRSAMDQLTTTEKEVIELRFFGELGYSEIAQLLEKKEDAIRQHVARAIKKMRIAMSASEH